MTHERAMNLPEDLTKQLIESLREVTDEYSRLWWSEYEGTSTPVPSEIAKARKVLKQIESLS